MPLKLYNSLLIRRPYVTQAVSAFVLFGAGDVVAQQAIEGKGRDHDLSRTARLACYGGFFFAPIITRWYSILEGLKSKSRIRMIVTRVGLDQFFLTPIMVGAFYTSQALLEGQGIEEAKHRLNNSWQPTLVKNWILFIPVQLANFSIIPPHLRLVLVNVVSLFWNAYLSYSNANLVADEAGIEDLVTVKG